jgi:orotidine-5'-phosphate decarboxylase
MTTPFADRLADAVRSKRSALVVGLDPQLEKFPRDILAAAGVQAEAAAGADGEDREAAAAAIEAFDAAVIEEVAPFAAAVKPQVAFYERWGPPGLAAFERAAERAHAAGLLVIGDVKRGDIGSTATAYAAAHLGTAEASGAIAGLPRARSHWADAITVNPYFGTDGIQPFIDAARQRGAGLFVLVRTSNATASELQDLQVGGRPLHEHVAERVRAWGKDFRGECGYSSVGAVVGATAPRELARLRSLLPQTWLLIPGVGAQGATAADVGAAFDAHGLGALVNSSRAILYAYGSPSATNWRLSVRDAAQRLRDELRSAALQATS